MTLLNNGWFFISYPTWRYIFPEKEEFSFLCLVGDVLRIRSRVGYHH